MSDTIEHLFGVEHGAINRFGLTWTEIDPDHGSFINIEVGWANRRATSIVIVPRAEQSISHYVAIWMDLIMNGSWQGKAMAALKVRRAIEKSRESGASVRHYGGNLPKN